MIYYKPLPIIGYENIFKELEPIYLAKVPKTSGGLPEHSFTMFTVGELSTSKTLVNIVKDLGLFDYWRPGPIYTLGPHRTIPIHMDYNFKEDWANDKNLWDNDTILVYSDYELLPFPIPENFEPKNAFRESIIFPLKNCHDTQSYFYDLKPGKSTTLHKTHENLYYHVASLDDVTIVQNYVLKQPGIFNLAELHSAANFGNKTRITLDIRFEPCDAFEKLKNL